MYACLLRTVTYALIFFFGGGILSVVGWVWMIAEPSLMLLESISPFCFWLETLFYLIFENVLVISFSTFCFEISALGLFYLGALLGCCLWVVAESEGCRVIFFAFISHLIQKYKNILLFAYLCIAFILHWHSTCIRFGWWIIVKFSNSNDCNYIWRKNLASHVVAHPVFHSTHCTWHCLLGLHFYFTVESS